ncbi:TPA: TIGR04255 family protein [Klebsiella pneumoniae]|uniref:TIGR04255 family protein n=3 Tax=Klebsiella pneumoniae TaxID=573 RepID=A0A486D151_KLEPN|nr:MULTISPECIES: TIGR04255 family protein [Klebsiella]HBX3912989.1 TIGR04255 family protein [Klebsiella pneumoniae subsp. pneumoniae]ELQ4519199.1 TIGR04255 family protein [Klebsiella pneumoniae]MBC4547108.1 TIGR04255 family protein [Klebsiella pneumoniae]MBG1739514.1 TIGR04255 family protein [Klebsiella pneumoniae]MBT9334836.1 TIGR04255 family protein [Klebsiella sp. O852]
MSNDLVFVLARVQFGSVTNTKFAQVRDAIQEQLREAYPFLDQRGDTTTFEVQFGPEGQKVNKVEIPSITLISAERNWGVRVTTSDVYLYTNSYVNFESFGPRLSVILERLTPIFPIYYTGFIGMRFLNKFSNTGERAFPVAFKRYEFLQPMLESYKGAGSNLSAKYQTDAGWMNLNSGVTVNGPLLPPDLEQFAVTLNSKSDVCEGPWAHLDLDSHKPDKSLVKFDKDRVISILSSLKDCANKFYNGIVNT